VTRHVIDRADQGRVRDNSAVTKARLTFDAEIDPSLGAGENPDYFLLKAGVQGLEHLLQRGEMPLLGGQHEVDPIRQGDAIAFRGREGFMNRDRHEIGQGGGAGRRVKGRDQDVGATSVLPRH
jgi:hypothetical protein